MTGDLLFKEVTEKIIGTGIKVHRNLGPGFVEKVYKQSLKAWLESDAFKNPGLAVQGSLSKSTLFRV